MYAIRLTGGRPAKIRDGLTLRDPMLDVFVDRFVLFHNLPKGVDLVGTPEYEIVAVKGVEDVKRLNGTTDGSASEAKRSREEYAKRVAVKIAKQKAAGKAKAEEGDKKKAHKKASNPTGKATLAATVGK